MRGVVPIITALALVHMSIAIGCLVISSGAGWHYFETGEETWWAMPVYWFSRILFYPLAFWFDRRMPTLGDVPLWDGEVRDYFGGLMDYPNFFANSMIWACLAWGAWRLSRRART